MIDHCSRAYNIQYVNSTSVLKYQHQLELKQKNTDITEVPKVGKNYKGVTATKADKRSLWVQAMTATTWKSIRSL